MARARTAGEPEGAAPAERRRARRAELLAAALAGVGAAACEEDALRALLRGALDLLEGEHGVARLFGARPAGEGCRLVVRLTADGTVDEGARDRPLAAGSFAAAAAAGGAPALVEDFWALDPRTFPYGGRMREKGMRSALLVPIEVSGGRIGCFSVDHHAPGFFGAEDLAAAQSLAGRAGAAIERARRGALPRAGRARPACGGADRRAGTRPLPESRREARPGVRAGGAPGRRAARPRPRCGRLRPGPSRRRATRQAAAELRCRLEDGSWLWVEAVGTNLIGVPSVGAVLVTCRDVSARRHAEERQAERIRLDGALLVARTVAHELNNALSPVVGFAELLAARPEIARDGALAEYVRLIGEAAQTAADKVLRLQRITRLEEADSPLGPDRPVLDLERSAGP